MNLSKLSAIGACCALVVSCSGDKKAAGLFDPIDYTLTVTDIKDADSTYAYIYDYDAVLVSRNFDSETLIDSALIVDGQAVFDIKGSTAPILALKLAGGTSATRVFPEAGKNTFNFTTNEGSGKIAKIYKAYEDSIKSIYASANANIPAEGPERLAFIDSVQALLTKFDQDALNNNIDNTFGFYQMAVHYDPSDITLNEIDSIVTAHPQFAKSKRIQAIIDDCKKFEATSAGHPYADFEIEYNGTTSKLSDYVKPGEYTLVDFWASWCGPCKRAIAGLKENYDSLKAKGLNIVGVGVWEDPEITEAWLAENPLPWPLILNAQSIPTNLYSITGIPTLLLIGPDGNIVIRSYSDEEVLEAFNKAIAG